MAPPHWPFEVHRAATCRMQLQLNLLRETLGPMRSNVARESLLPDGAPRHASPPGTATRLEGARETLFVGALARVLGIMACLCGSDPLRIFRGLPWCAIFAQCPDRNYLVFGQCCSLVFDGSPCCFIRQCLARDCLRFNVRVLLILKDYILLLPGGTGWTYYTNLSEMRTYYTNGKRRPLEGPFPCRTGYSSNFERELPGTCAGTCWDPPSVIVLGPPIVIVPPLPEPTGPPCHSELRLTDGTLYPP